MAIGHEVATSPRSFEEKGAQTEREEVRDPFEKERFGSEQNASKQASDVKLEFKLDPETRNSAMSVINRAFGEGGLDGQRGVNPEIAPEKHLKELKDIFAPKQDKYVKMLCTNNDFSCAETEDLAGKLNMSIKEEKMTQLQEISKEITGKTDIGTMFKIYNDATSARRGIPTADGDPAGDGFLWGKQETMKKFPEQFKGQNGELTPEAMKYWIESGLSYEAGRYTQGLARYLAMGSMNDAEDFISSLSMAPELFKRDANGKTMLTEDAQAELLKSLGNPKSSEELGKKLEETLKSLALKQSLLPPDASAEKFFSSIGNIYGLDPKESLEHEMKRAVKESGDPTISPERAFNFMIARQAAELRSIMAPKF